MIGNTTTRVDVFAQALLSTAATAMPTATILDGLPPEEIAASLGRDVLVVGVSTDESGEAYGSQQTLDSESGLGKRPVEVLTAHCELSTWSGDHTAGQGPMRTRLVGLLAAYDLALRTNPTLSAVCDGVHLGDRFRWYQLNSDDGPGTGVAFDVEAVAYL